MNKLDQRGALNILLIPFIMVCLFLVGVSSFGIWAYGQRQDYKNNADKKAAVVADKAVKAAQDADKVTYAELIKQPFDTYIGPAAYGNVTVKYPRTWSGYVQEGASSSEPVNAYFHPNVVPNVNDQNNAFALRVEVVQRSYDAVLSDYTSQIKDGKVTVAPYHLDKVPSVVGSRVEGQITSTKQGTMIILPLRNMTLKVSTESNTFKPDLDTSILPNLTFSP